jgi:hypothetical protein
MRRRRAYDWRDFHGIWAQLACQDRSTAASLRSTWRRCSPSQIGDVGKDAAEHVPRYGDLGHLEDGIAGMAHEGDVPLDVENRVASVAWVDGYAALDVSSRPTCLS